VPNVAIQRFVDSMRRPCPHHGCTAAVPRSDLQRHVGNCPFRPEALNKAREDKLKKLTDDQHRLEAEARGASAAQRLKIGKELLEVCRLLQESGLKLSEVHPTLTITRTLPVRPSPSSTLVSLIYPKTFSFLFPL